jgi:hypothetical protein
MKIETVGGLIGAMELMRQYQKEGGYKRKKIAAEWEKIIDGFIYDWNKDGINGSAYLLKTKEDRK